MSSPYVGNIAVADSQRSVAGPFTGVAQNLGSALSVNPVIAVFDNQSSVAVTVGINDVPWQTFVAGETFVLDLKANHGMATTFTFGIGTQFTVTATGGTGSFRLSILYAR